MRFTKKILFIFILLLILLIVTIFLIKPFNKSAVLSAKNQTIKIVLIGDSMTELLGHGSELEQNLKSYFPETTFKIANYGFGSTNILTLPDRLTKDSSHLEQFFPPILEQDYDIILIESFGHNPLSHLPLEEGLQKQSAILQQSIDLIKSDNPKTQVIFIATISPKRTRYAEGIVNLLPEQRLIWADERIAYIKNHIKFAKDHQIPLINIYQKSLDSSGDGNIDYINTNDFIHPSTTGIQFISREIADFLYKDKIIGS